PGFGSVLYSIFAFVFTAWYWGLDYIDWPAERRGWKVGERFAHARANFMTLFGFGTGVWLFLFIPFVNLLFMPAAVAGGTLLYLDMVGPAPDSGGEDPVAPPAAH
ncbi:MAG TPA: EI24 domain-containing protein, partial [Polyangiaceae bacterium LLY-WYZ-15_(1-7)]|nr:EI24 domain-containing protein [Polyangiaceae bacterium LLY-WYZ-15_(1-7)]